MTNELGAFVKAFKGLLIAKAQFEEAKDTLDEAKPGVAEYVQTHGEANRPGTGQRLVEWNGWKVQWTFRRGVPKLDTEKLLAWCQENAPELIVRVPTVPVESWEALKKLKRVSKRVIKQIETDGSSYYLRWWLSAEGECPKCGQTIGQQDSFCKHCGCKISFDKKAA